MGTTFQPGSILIPSPNGLERIETDNGGAVLAEVSIASLRDASGYQKASPLTGATLTMGTAGANYQSVLQLSPAGTIATLTVNLPPSPVDGQRALIFSTQTITALTLAAAGTTLNNAVTTLAALGNVEYIYSFSNNAWDRCQ